MFYAVKGIGETHSLDAIKGASEWSDGLIAQEEERRREGPARSNIHVECTNIFDIKVCADGYALGRIRIADVDFHANFVRVRLNNGVQECDGTSDEATGKWDDFCNLYPCCYETVRLPGIEGEWVCVIHPFGD